MTGIKRLKIRKRLARLKKIKKETIIRNKNKIKFKMIELIKALHS